MRFGMGELLIILALAILLFGAKRLPELATGMGKAIKNFRRGVEGDDEIDVTPPDKQVSQKSTAAAVDDESGVEEAELLEKHKATEA
jgi:sec-independent protein translocase protein TatA